MSSDDFSEAPELFEAFLDESEDADTGSYGVGGFVGKASVWRAFQPMWLAALSKVNLTFDATDCFTGNNAFTQLGAR
jgi:hypothetical protein